MEFSFSVADLVGKQFGNYRLLRLLGRGGFADVYLGKHLYLDNEAADAAIKVLQERLSDEGYRDFAREAGILVELSHPHIIRLRDFGVEGGQPFLVMDYAPHDTLREAHPRGTQIDLLTAITYLKQIADALQHAHNHKVIHCDLKPNNILLGRQRELLVSDFGIARVVSTTRPTAAQMEKHISGTALYMAPEQFQGKGSFASDQYSLAVTAYEWLCGRLPFTGSFVEIFSQHQLMPPASPRSYNPSIPHEVEQVLLRALAKDPVQRYLGIAAFAAAFEEAARPSLLEQTASSLPSLAPVAPLAAVVLSSSTDEEATEPRLRTVKPISEAGVTPDRLTPPLAEGVAAPSITEPSFASGRTEPDDAHVANDSIPPIVEAQPELETTSPRKNVQSASMPFVPVLWRGIALKPKSRLLLTLLAVVLLLGSLASTFLFINGSGVQTSGRASGGSSSGGEDSLTLTITVSGTNGTNIVHATATAGTKSPQSSTSPTAGKIPASTAGPGNSTGTTPTATQQSGTAPTATPTTAPTPTPTPHPCRQGSVTSNPIYQGNGYAYSNGGTYRTASAYCNGKAYFAFSEKPPVANTQVRLCETGDTTCGSWVKFTSVGSKLLIMSGMAAGITFHLQFRGYGATASYTVYGVIYY